MHSDKSIDVLGLGAPILDYIAYVSEDFLAKLTDEKGGMETVDLPTFLNLLNQVNSHAETVPGGCCANTIRGLAHLGRKCALIGKIGNDDIGKQLLKRLDDLHVKSFYATTTTPTAQVISFVTPDGERTCRSYLGACLEMTVDDLDIEAFTNVKLVHIEGYTLLYPGLTHRTMEYAREAGAIISFDLANFEVIKYYREVMIEYVRDYVNICLCNEEEIKTLTQCSNAEEGCLALQKLCDIAVVHTGKGAWAARKGVLSFSPAFTVEHPLDTTAAGDLFASGFLHGFLAHEPLETCLRNGNLLGTAVVQVQGSELPETTWVELRKQMNRMGMQQVKLSG